MIRSLRIGLDLGWLNTEAEGIKHWTVQTFRALVRDNPQHRFTLIWPHTLSNAALSGEISGPNVDVLHLRPQMLWWKLGRRVKVLSDLRQALRTLRRLDVIYWDRYAEISYPWLHLVPEVPKVATVFDAIPLAMPEMHGGTATGWWRQYVGRLREIGSHWLTISEHAKSDLVSRAGLDPALGAVVYPGHNFDGTDPLPPARPLPKAVAAATGGRPYLLAVGTLEPRKNHERLFRAFGILKARPEFDGWNFVVVGPTGWLYDDILRTAATTPGVFLAGRLNHADLANVYRHASAFAFPSLYEGFGLPVAEAMSFGLPTLTSSTTSLPEVAGDAAVLVDPTSDEAVRVGLERVMGDQDLRDRLRAAAPAQAAKFTWGRAARETMAVIESAAAKVPTRVGSPDGRAVSAGGGRQ